MRIYFSGLGGVGIGPAALLANDLGHDVLGSDISEGDNLAAIRAAGIDIHIGQDSNYLEIADTKQPIDWFVHTPALKSDDPELVYAKKAGIRTSKRYEFINQFTKEHGLKTIACSGSHGKTTSTAMMIWLFHRFDIPAAYTVGTNITWGPYGKYQEGAEYYIDEADEFDKKFLHFHPYVSILSKVDFDHAESYASLEDYKVSFRQFINQSRTTYIWPEDVNYLKLSVDGEKIKKLDDNSKEFDGFTLLGEHNRHNAFSVASAFSDLHPEIPTKEIINQLNRFPGTKRRFEKLSDNVYTDYAHHPTEIKATLQLAAETGNKIVAVYQPHQNLRQHHVLEQGGYGNCFKAASKVYWLPTYLTREDPTIKTISAKKLVQSTSEQPNIRIAEMGSQLWAAIRQHAATGQTVILMSAGDLDGWARKQVQDN